jgi:DNA-binding IclR family transcriptional regulator
MIKVIPKIVSVLELIAKNGEMGFTDLTNASGLSRSNMSHLLKSLCESELLVKKGHGLYGIGDKIYDLCPFSDKKTILNHIVTRCAGNVMLALNELAVISMRYKGQCLTLAKLQPAKNHQIINTDGHYNTINWYNTASGRVLLAFQQDDEIERIVEKHGLPNKHDWPAASTFEKLMKQVAEIRERRAVCMEGDNYVAAVGVPIADASGENAFCLSVAFLKMFHSYQKTIDLLNHYGEIMRQEIKFNRITVSKLEL